MTRFWMRIKALFRRKPPVDLEAACAWGLAGEEEERRGWEAMDEEDSRQGREPGEFQEMMSRCRDLK